jgi:hypothetical protein
MANAKKLHDMIEDADNLPEWVQSKITKAEDYISTVANYLTAEMSEETEIQEDEKKVNPNFKSLAPKDDHHTYYKFITGKAKMGKPLSQKEKEFATSYKLMKREEVEQIDELKKATLASYIDKAADSVKSKKDAAANMYRFTKQVTSAMKKSAEGDKRIEGIKSATKRLAKEEVEQIDEKNVPTSPEKWAQAKAQAKAKFDVYPSAYANGWAAKKYKAMGGGWKSVSEEVKQIEENAMHGTVYLHKYHEGSSEEEYGEVGKGHTQHAHYVYHKAPGGKPKLLGDVEHNVNDKTKKTAHAVARTKDMEQDHKSQGDAVQHLMDLHGVHPATPIRHITDKKQMNEAVEKDKPPFEPTKTKDKVVVGKYGKGYSTARHLARSAMQKQVEKMKKAPIKEESRKAAIVKDIMKKKKTASEDAFQKDPELSSTLTKM